MYLKSGYLMFKVLLVEDDAALRRGLVDNFKDEGYEVISASEGETGLDMILNQAPDIAILDVMLPRVSGFEICKAARMEELEFPIIMLTAKSQESDIVGGLDLGADDYVTKPFNINELLARVRTLLRRHKKADTESFEFGDCLLDREAREFRKDGKVVDLTAKEYRLLEYFLTNQGRALSRNSIMNSVWGSSVLVTQRSVDRCVTTLRSKVEDTPSKPAHIKTIRDVGYRFDV